MRCVCGYPREYHELSGACPLCACGAVPAEHVDKRCPGKSASAAGRFPTLRRGTFREPPPMPRMVPGPFGFLVPALEDEVVVEVKAGPPQVPARQTISLDEIAKQAMTLGRKAADNGWTVVPWYYRTWNGTEASILRLRRAELGSDVIWERARGVTGWKSALVYAWRRGQLPQKIGVKRLSDLIDELGPARDTV